MDVESFKKRQSVPFSYSTSQFNYSVESSISLANIRFSTPRWNNRRRGKYVLFWINLFSPPPSSRNSADYSIFRKVKLEIEAFQTRFYGFGRSSSQHNHPPESVVVTHHQWDFGLDSLENIKHCVTDHSCVCFVLWNVQKSENNWDTACPRKENNLLLRISTCSI